MDLREKRTKKNIRNAFLQLRASKSLERITIKELAELAEISKATFYLHYKDIYDLSDTLAKEVVHGLLIGITHAGMTWEKPGQFAVELTQAFYSQKNLINILFSGTQESTLPLMIENEIRAYILQERPDLSENSRFQIWLTFQIQGIYYAYKRHSETYGLQEVLGFVASASDQSMPYLN